MQMLRGMFGILITLLNSDKPIKREVLAAKFEISERTVSRYIDAMSADCGIPVVTSFGYGGGYSIADNYRLNSAFFTTDEYDRLLTAPSAVEKELSDGVTDSIRNKISCLRADSESEKYLVKNDRLIIDSSAWHNANDYRGTMKAINRAIDESRVTRMSYVDKLGSKTERDFEPYTLVLKEGVWYVYGFCRSRNDFRLFKLSRIKELSLKNENFELRDGGDVYEKLREEFIDREKVYIEIAFDGDALPAVEEWLGINCIRQAQDGYTAAAYVYSEDLLLKKLLSLGSHVKVLSPSFVAEELRVELKRALLQYENGIAAEQP